MQHRNYRIWFYGQSISLIGSWMQNMAQQVLVYELSGSAAALGIVSFIGLIPLLPFSMWGGSLVDRLPKRKVIAVAQWIQMGEALVLSVLAWTGLVEIWHVYVLSFLLGAVTAVDMPARQAFTIDLVEGKEDLTNAIGLNSANFNAARAIGPALAGVVVAAVGAGPAFLINGLTFVPVLFSLAAMRNLPEPQGVPTRGPGIEHMVEGALYTRRNPVMMLVMMLVSVSMLFAMPYGTLLPVFAGDVLWENAQPVVNFICEGPARLMSCQSPEALPLGMLLASVGIGALIGALTVAALPDNAKRGNLLTAGSISFPAILIIVAFSRSFLLTLFLMALVGLSFVWQNALANTIIQIMSPDAVRGRVMALYSMLTMATMRLGSLGAGYLADWIGAPLTLGLGSLVTLIYGLYVAFFRRDIRKL